jgi:ATP-dependent Clp protease ATP-binding subunit ClpA
VVFVADALVGRAGELATLTEAMSAASRGQGRLLLVRGEAGIGKTRLIDELAERAVSSHVVLSGRAVGADLSLVGSSIRRRYEEDLVG